MGSELITLGRVHLVVGLHNASGPGAENWSEFVRLCREAKTRAGGRVEDIRVLVVTDGGSPSPAQRNDINAFLENRPITTAVVSDSTMVRGVITALSWFNEGIKPFSPIHFASALQYIGVGDSALKIESVVGRIGTRVKVRTATIICRPQNSSSTI